MTAEKLHDALTLLPADLITEVDKKRSGRPNVISWTRYVAAAACLLLVMSSGWFGLLMFGGTGGSAKETAAEAPAEAAVMQNEAMMAETRAAAAYEEDAAAPEAAEEAPAAIDETLCALPTAPATGNTTSENTSLCIDHSHHPAEEFGDTETGSTGWCGNTSAVLYIGGEAHTIYGSDAITLTKILISLDYDPDNLCRCTAEYTADTEIDSGYEINLTEYFARFNGGQAGLTQEQADALGEIIAKLGGET